MTNQTMCQQKAPFIERIRRLPLPESAEIIITALLLGIGTGLGAVLLRWLIEGIESLAYDQTSSLFSDIKPFHYIIILAIGGLITGPLIYFFAQEAKGHGVPEIMEAVALRGGRIRPVVALVKSLASAVCIGTGGSAGSEGPIAQIGASLGSSIGQFFRLSDDRIRTLVACGAGGGIAAAFNAPIAGSMFAIEVILGNMGSVSYGAIVIASVVANTIARLLEGDAVIFQVPNYTITHPLELGLYAILGTLAAIFALGFTRLLYFAEDSWKKIQIPEYLKPAVGGVLLGIVGILTYKINGFPRVFGIGYTTINEALTIGISLKIAFFLLLLKMLATTITLGSGNSGGIFAPSLFMGAMLGQSFGLLVNHLLPGFTAPAGAYALVGMAAFFSGAARAPITSILILFEMTGNYHIILPLMMTTVVSTMVSKWLSKDTIYTLKLTRKGIHLKQGRDIDIMQGILVGEVMNTDIRVVQSDMPLTDLSAFFNKTHYHNFPVINEQGQLSGAVSLSDLDRALQSETFNQMTVKDIATMDCIAVGYVEEPIGKELEPMGGREINQLPIVNRKAPGEIVGAVSERDIILAYNKAITKRARDEFRAENLKLRNISNAHLTSFVIPPTSQVAGKQIRQLGLPADCLIVSILRNDKVIVANGYTHLQINDRLSIFVDPSHREHILKILSDQSQPIVSADQTEIHEEIIIPKSAKCAGQIISELNLPTECIMVNILRDGKCIIPHGNTKLSPNDVIELFGKPADLAFAKTILQDF